jgi:tetratricopeptide (TPR) repeat protein
LTVKQIGVWQNSISLWTYVINKEPVRAPLAYYNRGVFYAKKGQVDRALYDFKKTIMLDPSDYKAYYNLGVLYGSSGLFDMAIECFSMAIVIDQNYDVAYLYRGTYYARTGRMEQARADYQKACDLGNENGCRQVKLRQS